MSSNNHDYVRTTAVFEWTFAILVMNCTLHFYRLATQVVAFVFDLFKVTYGKSLFGPLNDDELEPYTKYLDAKAVLALKLVENIILVLAAYFGAKSLLAFSTVGLIVCSAIFAIHVIILILSAVLVADLDRFWNILTPNTLLWVLTLTIETLSFVMPITTMADF